MNPLELKCQGFHVISLSLSHTTPILIFEIKASTFFECKYQIISTTLLVFIDVGENSIMVDDATTPSNSPIVLVEKEKLEKT
jgi:hypothetical protein